MIVSTRWLRHSLAALMFLSGALSVTQLLSEAPLFAQQKISKERAEKIARERVKGEVENSELTEDVDHTPVWIVEIRTDLGELKAVVIHAQTGKVLRVANVEAGPR